MDSLRPLASHVCVPKRLSLVAVLVTEEVDLVSQTGIRLELLLLLYISLARCQRPYIVTAASNSLEKVDCEQYQDFAGKEGAAARGHSGGRIFSLEARSVMVSPRS
jgi:hypothetical protein